MKAELFIIEGINPVPWKAPTAATGRKGGKVFARLFADEEMKTYQAAVAEALKDYVNPVEHLLEVHFSFWRRRDQWQGATRQVTSQEADATNMQKSTEDALQKILYKNDRQIKYVSSHAVEQAVGLEPRIEILVMPYDKDRSIGARGTYSEITTVEVTG